MSNNLTMLDRLHWRMDGDNGWMDGYDPERDIGWVVTYKKLLDCWKVMYDSSPELDPLKDAEEISRADMTEEQLREYVTMKYLLMRRS
mgnify:CR=1 FL=1